MMHYIIEKWSRDPQHFVYCALLWFKWHNNRDKMTAIYKYITSLVDPWEGDITCLLVTCHLSRWSLIFFSLFPFLSVSPHPTLLLYSHSTNSQPMVQTVVRSELCCSRLQHDSVCLSWFICCFNSVSDTTTAETICLKVHRQGDLTGPFQLQYERTRLQMSAFPYTYKSRNI